MIKVKDALDELLGDIVFDEAMAQKVLQNNISFITSSEDHRQLFGGKALGCYYLKYNYIDKDRFYDNLFGLTTNEVIAVTSKITTINKKFKIATDDVNLVCFYVAYRFLSNKKLKSDKALEAAKGILTYFSYRTLVLISSMYFVYPMSVDKATSLTERLSKRYIIKQLKNWNEYCEYRSTEYLDSKFKKLLMTMNNDNDIPNAISDLYGRTKDTIKNIYSEFMDMLEKDEAMGSRKNLGTDVDGDEIMLDRLGGSDSFAIRVEDMLSDKNTFIKDDYIGVVCSMVNTITTDQLKVTLSYLLTYTYTNNKNKKEVMDYIHAVVVNSIDYLRKNSVYLHKKSNAIEIMNHLLGNVLYARGTDLEINKIKESSLSMLKKIYKVNKDKTADRTLSNLRNGLYIYIMLLAIVVK